MLPEARGHGLATRAVRLVVAWAFDALSVGEIDLRAEPANARSRGVAERAGFRLIESTIETVRYRKVRTDD